MDFAQIVRTIPNSRLLVPSSAFAVVLIALGVLLIAVGVAGMMKVRRHMNESASLIEILFLKRSNLAFLLWEYDEPDKVLLLLAQVGRAIGMVAVLWGAVGLFVN